MISDNGSYGNCSLQNVRIRHQIRFDPHPHPSRSMMLISLAAYLFVRLRQSRKRLLSLLENYVV